jgi:hypothetical protein
MLGKLLRVGIGLVSDRPSLVTSNVTAKLEACIEGPPKPTDQCGAECFNALKHLWMDDHPNMADILKNSHNIFAKSEKGAGKATINITDGLKWIGHW